MDYTPLRIDDIPKSNPLAVFHRYYFSIQRDPDVCPVLPNWGDFDPVLVPRVLTHISLIECLGDDIGMFTQCLMGEEAKAIAGGNMTGVPLRSAFVPQSHEARFAAIQKCMNDRCVMLSISDLPFEGREHLKVYRGAFPFCDSAARVSHIAMVLVQVTPNLEIAYGTVGPLGLRPGS